MKLKKIVLAAFIIMAVTLVMTGCPMTAKDYKAADKEIKAEEYQARYDGTLYNSIENYVQDTILKKLKGIGQSAEDVSAKSIQDYVKNRNEWTEKRELSKLYQHYGVKKRKIVYTGGDLKTETYKDKRYVDAYTEILKLFKIE